MDGEFATVRDTVDGIEVSAGPEEWNHAHHAMLWTKNPFQGAVKLSMRRLDSMM